MVAKLCEFNRWLRGGISPGEAFCLMWWGWNLNIIDMRNLCAKSEMRKTQV